MALDWTKCAAVESVPGKVSGAWVFRGTHLPVATNFENLEDGLNYEAGRGQLAAVSKESKHYVGKRFAPRGQDLRGLCD